MKKIVLLAFCIPLLCVACSTAVQAPGTPQSDLATVKQDLREINEYAAARNYDVWVKPTGMERNDAYTNIERFLNMKRARNVTVWQRAAERGTPEGQVLLGLRYFHGLGIPADEAVGVDWLRKAAEQGYADAQYSLGVCFARGIGVPQDERESEKWFGKVAEQVSNAAEQLLCANHEKQIVLALHNYHDTYGAFPPLYTVDEEGNPLHSWRVLILPFIEQRALYEAIRFDEPWDSGHNRQFHNNMPSIYRCPSSSGGVPFRDTTYSAIAGGSFRPATKAESVVGLKLSDVTDGTSNTLAIVEVIEPFNWMDPTADVTVEELVDWVVRSGRVRAGSRHFGGINAALLDGSVRFIAYDIDPEILRAMATPSGGESVRIP